MAKISELTAWATPVAANELAIVDTVASTTKKITYADVLGKAPVGTVTAPTWAFTGDSNSGFYWIGADQIGLTLGGTLRVDFGSAQVAGPDGTVALPGWSFTGDTDSGIYRIGANNIGIAVNATKILDILTTGLSVVGALLPNANDGGALGSATLRWSDLFLASGSVINFNNGDVTITHAVNQIVIAGGSNYEFDTNLHIGGLAARATTAGTNAVHIYNGTAPAGTLASGCSIYSTSDELYTMDAAGNATLQTPHNDAGEWIFFSKNTVTGQVLEIDMEKMMRHLNDMLGGGFIRERREL